MRRIMTAACAVWLALTVTGQAGRAAADTAESPVVVELYTSQGCSSCPPADEFLATIADRDDVIALALHVDYWDYIGWADSFAQPRFTKRQKGYALASGSKSIYTPQMIIGGQDSVVGNSPAEVATLVRAHGAKRTGVTLSLRRNGDILRITALANPPLDRELFVQLVRYMPTSTVAIAHGENAGQTITYRNVVTGWDRIAVWDGASPFDASVAAAGDDAVVVIMQAPFEGGRGMGEIVAAARLR